MKKFLGLILAGVMVMSMVAVVSASGSYDVDAMHEYLQYPSNWEPGGMADSYGPEAIAAYLKVYPDPRVSGSSSGGGSVEGYDEDFAAAALAAKEMGLSMDVLQGAEDANKSVGEYLNNSVNSVAGITNATPVAQGGDVIINGQPSNQTFSVNKPLPAHIDAAKAQAVAVGGRVMNCVDVDAGVYFDVATVNFYTPGITGAENVQVYHFTSGQWVSLNVAEVREDHVIVDMTAPGVLAFIEVPAETAE